MTARVAAGARRRGKKRRAQSNHEASLRADQVNDEATDDHLASEAQTQPATFERGPEALLRGRAVVADMVRPSFDQALARDDVARTTA